MDGYETFKVSDFGLQSNISLSDARLAFKTYGKLNSEGTNAIIYPTRYGGTHIDNEFLIGEGLALDPTKFFIVVPNKLGNGISSSPSNTPKPFNGPKFPRVTIYDNVILQKHLMDSLGIKRFVLAVGWSMGAQQAYQWACLFPSMIERLAVIAGSARCARHNFVFIEGVKAALTTDAAFNEGWYAEEKPLLGLQSMGRVWAGWALCQDWYRKELYKTLGYSSVEDYLARYWDKIYLERDPNDLLSMLDTWQRADISDNSKFNGDFNKALSTITARTYVMPGKTDLYFPPEDGEYESKQIKRSKFMPIPSIWGHYAGGGKDPTGADQAFINNALFQLLKE